MIVSLLKVFTGPAAALPARIFFSIIIIAVCNFRFVRGSNLYVFLRFRFILLGSVFLFLIFILFLRSIL